MVVSVLCKRSVTHTWIYRCKLLAKVNCRYKSHLKLLRSISKAARDPFATTNLDYNDGKSICISEPGIYLKK